VAKLPPTAVKALKDTTTRVERGELKIPISFD
jgi:hypothetical protein